VLPRPSPIATGKPVGFSTSGDIRSGFQQLNGSGVFVGVVSGSMLVANGTRGVAVTDGVRGAVVTGETLWALEAQALRRNIKHDIK
jgi:hypothetical protein